MKARLEGELSRLRRFMVLLFAQVRPALPALGGFAVVRLLCLVPPYLWARDEGKDFLTLLTSFDAHWYIQIAEQGYGSDETLLSLFPLLPALIRGARAVLGIDFAHAALVVSWLASLVAAGGLFAVGRHVDGPRTGIFLAIIWGALPNAILESMAYTEGLFTALSAWTLYALLKRRWLLAGTLCAIAGLSRPTASSLVGVVGLAALLAMIRRQDGVRPWIAAALAPLGWFGYLGWVARRTGRLDGWFHAQAVWGSSVDGGPYFVQTYWKVLTHKEPLHLTFVALMLLLACCLLIISVLDRQPWELWLFSTCLILSIMATAGFFHSKARFLLPAFPLLLPIARGLAKTAPSRALVIIATMAFISGAYGGYLQFLWDKSF